MWWWIGLTATGFVVAHLATRWFYWRAMKDLRRGEAKSVMRRATDDGWGPWSEADENGTRWRHSKD